jgi:hypothetical protein
MVDCPDGPEAMKSFHFAAIFSISFKNIGKNARISGAENAGTIARFWRLWTSPVEERSI